MKAINMTPAEREYIEKTIDNLRKFEVSLETNNIPKIKTVHDLVYFLYKMIADTGDDCQVYPLQCEVSEHHIDLTIRFVPVETSSGAGVANWLYRLMK